VQGFGASHALEDGHGVATDPAFIAVVQRAPEVQGVRVDVLEVVLARVYVDALGMEVLGAVGSGTLGGLVLSFALRCDLLFLAVVLTAFVLLGFLVLYAVVVPLLLTDETGHHVLLAVLAGVVRLHHLLQVLLLYAQLRYVQPAADLLDAGYTLHLHLLAALRMEGALTETFAVVGALWVLAQET
jgi:hypothetical protein